MPQPHERLGEAMNERRLELRLNWRQVSEAAGISYEGLRSIRRGDYRPTELTARGLDVAFGWTHGSTITVLAGGDPTLAEEAGPADDADDVPEVDRGLSEELELAQRLVAATIREMKLSPAEADEVWRRVRQEIERTHAGETEETPQNQQENRAG